MDSKIIYVSPNYDEYEFKTKRIWRTDGKYEPFVYIIQEIETDIKYIGSKTEKGCLESWLGTKYFTSSKEFDWESNPESFKICEIIPCASNHDAIILESELIDQNNAIWSDNYYNKSRAGKIFNSSGCTFVFSEEHKNKLSIAAQNREVNENAISAMQLYTSGSRWMKNNIIGKDKRVKEEHIEYYLDNGWELGRINVCNDTSISKWKQSYHSNPNNKNRTLTIEQKRKIGESSKGTIPVKDNQGNKFKCNVNDPKYISGEYQHVTKGNRLTEHHKQTLKKYICVRDTVTGKTLRCLKDDDNYLSGRYVGVTKGMKIKCPHCGKEGQPGVMKRWHFDNCKHHKEKYIESNILDLP